MSYEGNNETQDAIKTEINLLRSRCVDMCNIIENSPIECVTPENYMEKVLCYVEGVRTDIENSNTLIVSDENLLTAQYLNEIKQKISEVKELIALKKACIHDVDAEINRIKSLIEITRKAKCQPKVQKEDVCPEHLQKAKERFQMMKNELHGLIQALFPDNPDIIMDVLGQLMAQKQDETSGGYVPITSENYHVIGLLTDSNIVKTNPYNNMEVKLAY